MSTFKKHTIVMLAAKRSKLFYSEISRKLEVTPVEFLQSEITKTMHLYVIDEHAPIDNGTDWVVFINEGGDYALSQSKQLTANTEKFKVVASTNPEIKMLHLREDNEIYFTPIPEPSMAFLERYCDKDGITPVMVEYDSDKIRVSSSNTITIKPVEETYTREELDEILDDLFHDAAQDADGFYRDYDSLEDWKKKNLK